MTLFRRLTLFAFLILLSCNEGDKSYTDKSDNSEHFESNSQKANDEVHNDEDDNTISNEEDDENIAGRKDEQEEEKEKFPDDTYCAEVEYYNPKTGTRSSYTLTVEVESNEVVEINFPNGGWLDNDHFSGADLEDDGTTNFTSDRGYEYDITIIGSDNNCFTDDVPRAVQCSGETKDGDQCENLTDNLNGLCWQHQDQD